MSAAEVPSSLVSRLESALQEKSRLEVEAKEVLGLDARLKWGRNNLVKRMAAAGIRRIDVAGVGAVSFVDATTADVTDGKKLVKRFLALVDDYAACGGIIDDQRHAIPLTPCNRAASIRLSHKAGVGLEMKDEEELG